MTKSILLLGEKLMSKETIPPPVKSGSSVVLPFYPGCLYVAYQADDNNPVSFQLNCIKTNQAI